MILPTFFTLFTAVSSYRLFEYAGQQCNSAELGILRLAGPSACTKLQYGTESSVLVKVDNVNDNKYDVVFYVNEDCTGGAVGRISDANTCYHTVNPLGDNTTPKSVKVVPRASDPGKRDLTDILPESCQETRHEYNHKHSVPGTLFTPIRPGVFARVNMTNVESDGTFSDERINDYYPMDDVHYTTMKSIWQGNVSSHELLTRAVARRSMVDISDLEKAARQFEFGKCSIDQICQAVSDATGIPGLGSIARFAHWAESALKGIPWSKLGKGLDLVVSHFANGATLYSTFSTTGNQPESCDSKYDTGALSGDAISTIKDQAVTNAIQKICQNNGTCVLLAFQMYMENHDNPVSCGKCPQCL